MVEALAGGSEPAHESGMMRSKPGVGGLVTELHYQSVGTTRYFDAAGFAGRTVGLDSKTK